MAAPVSPPSSPPEVPEEELNNTPSTTTKEVTSSNPVTPDSNRFSKIGGSISFADRRMSCRPSTAPNPIVEGDGDLIRDVHHILPGDPHNKRKSKTTAELAKRRSSYYEEAFQYDRETNLTKDRVHQEAIVMVELRTNVIVSDELNFITDFAYQLSIRYQRPVASIVVNLQHGACMLFGGTFDPAYTMTIHAISTEVGVAKNKRNAALLQKHLQNALGVVPARGFVRFIDVSAENMATNGKTTISLLADVIGEDEETLAERRARNRKSIGTKSLSSVHHRSFIGSKKTAAPDFRRDSDAIPLKEDAMEPSLELTPPHSATDTSPVPPIPGAYAVQNTQPDSSEKDVAINEVDKAPLKTSPVPARKPKVAKRKSNFVSLLFSRTPKNSSPLPSIAS